MARRPLVSADRVLIDFTFILALAFVCLFIIALIQMNKKTPNGVERKAEYLVEMSWPDNSPDDIDL